MPVVELCNVSLWRRTQEELAYDLKRIVLQSLERRYRRPARRRVLHGIDLSIERGEKIGIIGPNGAGKSTLLKVISHIFRPTTGTVEVRGRVAPLIELGAGFDSNLSVTENIIYYGVLLGFSRMEMRSQVNSILEFAELEEYRRSPLKALSSGMVARLGFAVATDRRPEILILDEVLSVGDERFRRKSTQRIKEFWDAHSTIIVVSHDTDFIASQCERAVWLDHGLVVETGPAAKVASRYIDSVYSNVPVNNAFDFPVGFSLDAVSCGEQTQLIEGNKAPIFRVAFGETTKVAGWAIDLHARKPARGVVFEIDGMAVAKADCLVPRPDVAEIFGDAEMERCGFEIILPTNKLDAGFHSVSLHVVTHKLDTRFTIPKVLSLEVAGAPEAR
jgi:ABC-2 type transport system ATP-binding protein